MPGLTERLFLLQRGLKLRTKSDMAQRLGVSRTMLHNYENDSPPPPPELLSKMEELERALAAEQRFTVVGPGRSPASTPSQTTFPPDPSSKLHEEPSSYRATMKPNLQDSDALLRHLVANMSRDEMFELLGEFTRAAQAGDLEAFAKARALFDLIPPEKIPVPSSSG